MKSRTLISIVAFVLAFSIGVAFAPKNQPSKWRFEKNCYDYYQPSQITTLLEKDIENGRIRNDRLKEVLNSQDSVESRKNIARITKEYVEASRSISTEDLPPSFVKAWEKHLRAWEKYADYLNELSATQEDVDAKANQLRNEINETWMKVLKVAKRYNAEIPQNAY
ncbi:MAG: hypothetical protein N2Z23_05460 [Pyrinomonadaceae bacterium]|nr:hypothetical protein [Pyrinomonadaceae bacterium]MCX7639872.1 hypothetical protein [Pyrinomonadaceae bacterium]